MRKVWPWFFMAGGLTMFTNRLDVHGPWWAEWVMGGIGMAAFAIGLNMQIDERLTRLTEDSMRR